MKKRRAEIFIAIVAIILFIIMALYSAIEGSRQYPDYTVFSSKEYGASLIYDSLAIYGINVKTGYRRIDENTSIKDVYIIINPGYRYFYDSDISDIGNFVKKGGRLILAADLYLTSRIVSRLDVTLTDVYDGNYYSQMLKYGDGLIMTLSAEDILNGRLKDYRFTGEEIAKVLSLWDYDSAVFNEYYHGFGDDSVSMWKDLPFAYKLVVYQLLIAFVFFILSISKRFGKPIPLYEEVERTENEYIYAMANFFRSSKHYNSAAESYYRRLLEETSLRYKTGFSYARDNIRDIWTREKLPQIQLLDRVISEYSKEFDKKRLKDFAKDVNDLINILKEGA